MSSLINKTAVTVTCLINLVTGGDYLSVNDGSLSYGQVMEIIQQNSAYESLITANSLSKQEKINALNEDISAMEKSINDELRRIRDLAKTGVPMEKIFEIDSYIDGEIRELKDTRNLLSSLLTVKDTDLSILTQDKESLEYLKKKIIQDPVIGDTLVTDYFSKLKVIKPFGELKGQLYSMPSNEIKALYNAVICDVGNTKELGNYITTALSQEVVIVYGHLDSTDKLKVGDIISQDELIGTNENKQVYIALYIDGVPMELKKGGNDSES